MSIMISALIWAIKLHTITRHDDAVAAGATRGRRFQAFSELVFSSRYSAFRAIIPF